MPANLTAQYASLVATGEIERDRAQGVVLDRLAVLDQRLAQHRLARKSSSLGWVFGARERREEPSQGLCVFGDCGGGQTIASGLFFAPGPGVRAAAVDL